jgi:hypothetical protein
VLLRKPRAVRPLDRGAGRVELPNAFARKHPSAGRSVPWQWVFPATRTYRHPETNELRRHHLHETVVQLAAIRAIQELLGHKDASTTMIYTHVVNRGLLGVRSPAGRLRLTVSRRELPRSSPIVPARASGYADRALRESTGARSVGIDLHDPRTGTRSPTRPRYADLSNTWPPHHKGPANSR